MSDERKIRERTQDIVQDQVEKIAAEAGFRLGTDTRYANEGFWRFYDAESFALAAEIEYSFGLNYFELRGEGFERQGLCHRDMPSLLEDLRDYVMAKV